MVFSIILNFLWLFNSNLTFVNNNCNYIGHYKKDFHSIQKALDGTVKKPRWVCGSQGWSTGCFSRLSSHRCFHSHQMLKDEKVDLNKKCNKSLSTSISAKKKFPINYNLLSCIIKESTTTALPQQLSPLSSSLVWVQTKTIFPEAEVLLSKVSKWFLNNHFLVLVYFSLTKFYMYKVVQNVILTFWFFYL